MPWLEYNLMIGHDPYSVPIATVAGTISTNGVGYRASAFGPMGQQVVSLQVVLPDGRSPGHPVRPQVLIGAPNFNHLFIGGEGVFGIITRATIQASSASPKPRYSPRPALTPLTRASTLPPK